MQSNQINLKIADSDPLRVKPIAPEISVQESTTEALPEIEVKFTRNFMLLEGEKNLLHKGIKRAEAIPCSVFLANLPALTGQFSLTNYRIVVEPNEPQWCYQNKIRIQFFDIPLLLMNRIDKIVDKNNTSLDISTKDGRNLRIVISNILQSDYNVFPTLYSGAFPQNPINRFCFSHSFSGQIDGWKLYNPRNDYARLGVNPSKPDCRWKFLDNSTGEFCETYPETIVVPKELSLMAIKTCASFRSRNRLPVLVWCNTRRSATLWRCSQPKTGIRTSRCVEDEDYLRALAQSSQRDPMLHIFDARPYVNAHAQRALGGGVENVNHYDNTELHFLNIENIHAIRESWTAMMIGLNNVNPSRYLSAVEKSGWLEHVSLLLQGAVGLVESLQNGISCLIHCSDGWDRTSQLCSLVQICMDSHYRSLRGFAQVIEKDWVSFGHQFEVRLAHSNPNLADDKRSPIFIQFLDCVYQLVLQFPTHFEFNSILLHDLAHFAFSGRFGTFMCNSMKERATLNLFNKTSSVWSYVFENLDTYTNPYYQPGQDDPITPVYCIRRLFIWHDVFSQWQTDFYYQVPQLLGPNDHKEALMRSAGEGMQLYKALIMQKDQEIRECKKLIAELKKN
jgi:myotubularin-related protein 1/2